MTEPLAFAVSIGGRNVSPPPFLILITPFQFNNVSFNSFMNSPYCVLRVVKKGFNLFL